MHYDRTLQGYVGSDHITGTDEGGKPIYDQGHRRCNGIWACPRVPISKDHAYWVHANSRGMRKMHADGCYRRMSRLRAEN